MKGIVRTHQETYGNGSFAFNTSLVGENRMFSIQLMSDSEIGGNKIAIECSE